MPSILESLWPPIIFEIRDLLPDPDKTYLVGGIVRDILKRRPIHDIDITTAKDSLKAARIIANSFDGAYVTVDHDREIGRAIIDHAGSKLMIDVARFREGSLEEDLRAREFTVNAMAVSFADLGEVIDPLGGFDDLSTKKLLNLCSSDSITQDPIRAIRGIRHALTYGLRIPPETSTAIRKGAPSLTDETGELIQPERVRDELFKMLARGPVVTALKLYHHLGLLKQMFPFPVTGFNEQIRVIGVFESLLSVISYRRDDNDAASLFMASAVMILDRYRADLNEHFERVYGDDRRRFILSYLHLLYPGDMAIDWKEHFRLTRSEAKILATLAGWSDEEDPLAIGSDKRGIHRYFHGMGDAGIDNLLIELARAHAKDPLEMDPVKWGEIVEHGAAPLLDAYFNHHDEIIAPSPLIDGHKVREIRPDLEGAAIGELIDSLIEAQAAGEVTTQSEAFLFLRRK